MKYEPNRCKWCGTDLNVNQCFCDAVRPPTKTPIFNASNADTQKAVLEDLEILEKSDGLEFSKAVLRHIANFTTDGDYKSNYFYFRALAEKSLEHLQELSAK
jgi:hypothetical protein